VSGLGEAIVRAGVARAAAAALQRRRQRSRSRDSKDLGGGDLDRADGGSGPGSSSGGGFASDEDDGAAAVCSRLLEETMVQVRGAELKEIGSGVLAEVGVSVCRRPWLG
jgi:hypothetical protein